MKKNKYLFSLLGLVSASLAVSSCSDFSKSTQTSLNKHIQLVDEVSPKTVDKNKQKTEDIINKLLNQVFKGSQSKILQFLDEQKANEVKIRQEFLEAKESFKVAKSNGEHPEFTNSVNQRNFFAKNWYFFLTHLDEFEFNFVEYVFDGLKNGKTASEEYKATIANKPAIDSFKLKNNLLENIKNGDESKEISNTNVYYILKGKMVFRLSVNDLDQEQPTVTMLPMFWYFPESRAKSISIALISSIVHTLFIHNYPQAYSEFEKVMVVDQRYGSPVFVYPTIIEQKGEENESK
ncbi:aromatic motif membrane protein [Mycoplasma sp. OR1901]|uniref:aromatic motif membrane protein n=1 Tax=Mycoplasma sp. OR1901 TaxID=2742195 RepID=UPI0015831C9F|nr:aromatic motif membrane protein [Mycoplasma sp. OR1901]QKT05130.1 hypothetical protein HTZ87_00140 [Mycoplasma sp. OR1901]